MPLCLEKRLHEAMVRGVATRKNPSDCAIRGCCRNSPVHTRLRYRSLSKDTIRKFRIDVSGEWQKPDSDGFAAVMDDVSCPSSRPAGFAFR